MIPHYPSTAELAAFRRSIHNRTSNHGLYEPCITDDKWPTTWPGERGHGIGFRWSGSLFGYAGCGPDAAFVNMRHEASAMRSRAYAQHRLDWSAHEHAFAPSYDAYSARATAALQRVIGPRWIVAEPWGLGVTS
jgi:hypothetical protein